MKDSQKRWLEAGKSVLIVCLALSALYLLGRTQLFAEATGASQGWVSQLGQTLGLSPASTDSPTGVTAQTAVIRAVAVVLMGEEGRYGSQYNTEEVDQLYSKTPNVLADALQRANSPSQVAESQWQGALAKFTPGLYLDFLGAVPCSVLAHSVGGGVTDTLLTASIQRLLLTTDSQGSAILYYQDETDDHYYCATIRGGNDLALRLTDLVEDYTPNGVSFAFEQESLYEGLYPYTLIEPSRVLSIPSYDVVNPTVITDDDSIAALLQDLSFHYQSSQIVRSSDFVSVREGSNDSLKVYNDGEMVYHATSAEESRFLVTTPGEVPGMLETVESVWALLEQVTFDRRGEARLYLISVEETGEGYVLTFGYQLNGAQILVGGEGYAAQVVVSNGAVVDIELQLRSYGLSQTTATSMLPLLQTQAIVASLGMAEEELRLCYPDSGTGWIGAEWVVQSR